eukprot:CAMPEP_0172842074 /NCGR_PEP_ID=MMETSP1075-20121228/30465_1 /TAXON_ID=2916 /ORGANISM="Ceratium fusus, Strain PA161109" /LENGTH=312 /DNA_ID=CAMNT_0013686143 /DNA_START=37 /DNA_END=972 /DNA_ORIENTATION=+
MASLRRLPSEQRAAVAKRGDQRSPHESVSAAAVAARFASKSPARRSRIVAALQAADRLDRQAAECCSTSKRNLFACCTSSPDVAPSSLADGTFSFVPGWSAKEDYAEEVSEHRAVTFGSWAQQKQSPPASALRGRKLKDQPRATTAFAPPPEDLPHEPSPRRPMGSMTSKSPCPALSLQLQETSDVESKEVAYAFADEAAVAAAVAIPALVPQPAHELKSSRPPSSNSLPSALVVAAVPALSPRSDATVSTSTPRSSLPEAAMAGPTNHAITNAWMTSKISSWFGLQGQRHSTTAVTDANLPSVPVAETGST